MNLLWVGMMTTYSFQISGQIIRHEFSDTYHLNMGMLLCESTTEDGSDEVYMIILYKYDSGESGNSIAPDQHWSMYREEIIISGNVFTFTLRNESIDILCILMEDDDYPLRDIMADEILTRVNARESRLMDIRISTLQKIVHDGLDGELQLNIKLRQRTK